MSGEPRKPPCYRLNIPKGRINRLVQRLLSGQWVNVRVDGGTVKAEHDSHASVKLWHAIQDRLDRFLPGWTQQIEHFGQVAAVERREAGSLWTDNEVFEAVLRAVLSNNTDWAKVERILPELQDAFSGFSLCKYAETTLHDVECRLVPWFKERRAGSMTLRRSLISLVQTARILRDWSTSCGAAEHYFLDVIATSGGDPKVAVLALGDWHPTPRQAVNDRIK